MGGASQAWMIEESWKRPPGQCSIFNLQTGAKKNCRRKKVFAPHQAWMIEESWKRPPGKSSIFNLQSGAKKKLQAQFFFCTSSCLISRPRLIHARASWRAWDVERRDTKRGKGKRATPATQHLRLLSWRSVLAPSMYGFPGHGTTLFVITPYTFDFSFCRPKYYDNFIQGRWRCSPVVFLSLAKLW